MATNSSMQLQPGTPAPPFSLEEVSTGETVTLDDVAGGAPAVVVMFISNHCPYVRHVEKELGALASEYSERGVAFVGICVNDVDSYPDDAPEALAEQKRRAGFTFPYLHDPTQEVAKVYRAACTPDFFVFDSERRLFYRGRMDETRPGGDPPTGADLRAVLDALLAGRPYEEEQWPSLGCSIKWSPGNAPAA